ncbi:MAG: hypothetical protein EPO08_13725 [Rhodospirillaceae bacterium]|nr:MAG: hypothetical protein EPO08_13725 [Rhodospirillaceae bacterium]
MGLQFEHITFTPQFSLTQIVDDTAYLRREGSVRAPADGASLEAWLNAVQRQSTPLIQSRARRAELEAWLAAAESMTGGTPSDGPSGL